MRFSNSLVNQRFLRTLGRWFEWFRQYHLERCLRRTHQRCRFCDFTRHFDDLVRGHAARVCHDDLEPHALWLLAQEHSRYRVMLASLYDGPTRSITCELDQHQVVFRDHCQLPHHYWTHKKRYRCWLQFFFRNRHSPRIRLRVFVRFLQGCVLPRGTATHHEWVCLNSAPFRDFGIFVLRNRWFRNRWVIVIVHRGLNSTSRSGGSAAFVWLLCLREFTRFIEQGLLPRNVLLRQARVRTRSSLSS